MSSITITRQWTVKTPGTSSVRLDAGAGSDIRLLQDEDIVILELSMAEALLELLPLAIEQAQGVPE